MKITAGNIGELPEAASRFLEAVGDRRLFAFEAPMGAGKTTFIAALCKALGCLDEASSPTFSIINEYARPDGEQPVFHFDFYRIDNPADAADLGLDDYFDSGSYCFMEWPGQVEEFLPEDVVEVRISPLPDGAREIEWNI